MANYILLERVELNASAASVTFDNIPQSGYTDLKVAVSARGTDSNLAVGLRISFNGVTTNLSDRYLFGTGAGTSSGTDTFIYINEMNAATSTANTFTSADVYIPNYTSSNFKSVSVDAVMENNATTAYSMLNAGLWSSTAAITSATIYPSSGSLVANSTFSLYGVADVNTTPVIAPKATGGNIVANDGTYWYHGFLSSGNFVPQVGLTADILVIAGGGGGGSAAAGGGGAGGLLSFTSESITPGTYTCTVGAGGTGSTSGTENRGGTGVDSQFGSLTLVKGGGGGGSFVAASPYTNSTGGDGGSGGGGIGRAGLRNGGTATSGQGNNGGSGNSDEATYRSAGGGGGAGAAGTNGNSSAPDSAGAGGNGVSTYSSWGSATSTGQNISGTYWYAGGGGGANSGATGTGGNGGGTAGAVSTSAANATANTGGGGGALGNTASGQKGGNGGSGIVIIRYAMV